MLRWRLSSAVFREKLKTLLNKPIHKPSHRGGLGYWIKVSGIYLNLTEKVNIICICRCRNPISPMPVPDPTTKDGRFV